MIGHSLRIVEIRVRTTRLRRGIDRPFMHLTKG